jgi:hypothetical protein
LEAATEPLGRLEIHHLDVAPVDLQDDVFRENLEGQRTIQRKRVSKGIAKKVPRLAAQIQVPMPCKIFRMAGASPLHASPDRDAPASPAAFGRHPSF